MEFSAFHFDETILQALEAMGYQETTPVQAQAIPIIQAGQDLIACAQTGTGKTAAFVLPIIDRLLKMPERKGISVLIIASTRELVLQIDQQIDGLAYFTRVSSKAVYGGNDGKEWDLQRDALDAGADIIVAVPGRLISFLGRNVEQFRELKILVLDEADQMLDMGFLPQIQKIIDELPRERQTLLFSATMPQQVRRLAEKILHNPQAVDIAISKPAESIQQFQFQLQHEAKPKFLNELVKRHPEFQSIIIFVKRKSDVRTIVRGLLRGGINTCGISADLEQAQREEALRDFKAHKVTAIVATDILSRGIDIEEVSLVVNYDVPVDPEAYVHRIGRTGRASATGIALTLVSQEDGYLLRRIEKFLDKSVPLLQEEWAQEYLTPLAPEDMTKRKSKRTPRRNTAPRAVGQQQKQGEGQKRQATAKNQKSGRKFPPRRKPKTEKVQTEPSE